MTLGLMMGPGDIPGCVNEWLDLYERFRDIGTHARRTREAELVGNVAAIMHGTWATNLCAASIGWTNAPPATLSFPEGWMPTVEMATKLLRGQSLAGFQVIIFMLDNLAGADFTCATKVLEQLVPEHAEYNAATHRLRQILRESCAQKTQNEWDDQPVNHFTNNGVNLGALNNGPEIFAPSIAGQEDLVLPHDQSTLKILELLALCTEGKIVRSQEELDQARADHAARWYIDPLPDIENLERNGPCHQATSLGAIGDRLEGSLCCFCSECSQFLQSVSLGPVLQEMAELGYTSSNTGSTYNSTLETVVEELRLVRLRSIVDQGEQNRLLAFEEMIGVSPNPRDFAQLRGYNLHVLRVSRAVSSPSLQDIGFTRANQPGGEALRGVNIWAVETFGGNVALCSMVRSCVSYRLVHPKVARKIVETFSATRDHQLRCALASTLFAQTQLYLGMVLGGMRGFPTLSQFPLGLADCCSVTHDPAYSTIRMGECDTSREILTCSYSAHDEQIPPPVSFFIEGVFASHSEPVRLLYYSPTHKTTFNLMRSWIAGRRLGVLTAVGFVKSLFTVADLHHGWSGLREYLEGERTGREFRNVWADGLLQSFGTVTADHDKWENSRILPPNLFTGGVYQVRPMDELLLSASIVCNTIEETRRLLDRRQPQPVEPTVWFCDIFLVAQMRMTHILLAVPALDEDRTSQWVRQYQHDHPQPYGYSFCRCLPGNGTLHDDALPAPPWDALRLVVPSTSNAEKTVRRLQRNPGLEAKKVHISVLSHTPLALVEQDSVWYQTSGVCGNCASKQMEPYRCRYILGAIRLPPTV